MQGSRYRRETIDVLAQNVLKDYDQSLVCGTPREIPIDEIAEIYFGLIMQYRMLTKTGSIHGITVFEDSMIPIYNKREKRYETICVEAGTVLIDERLLAENRLKRLRFTIAHELAHWMIHKDYYKEKGEEANKTSEESSEQTEREADALGAALLMPRGRMKALFHTLKPSLTKEACVRESAKVFCVSNEAMEIRLKSAGLI